MNEFKVFENLEFGKIRTLLRDSEPWFVASDVMELFQATNKNRMMQKLDEDKKGYTQMYTPGGKQQMAVVNE